MKAQNSSFQEPTLRAEVNEKIFFNEKEAIHDLKHYLPAQAPLKDFIHHNTLHAFQNLKFNKAIRKAAEILGYKGCLTVDEYRALYASNRIKDDILERTIIQKKGLHQLNPWKAKLITTPFDSAALPRIGQLKSNWKRLYKIDLDSLVHPILFRTLCSYLDQGISMWNFPVWHHGLLPSLREMEKNSFSSFFKTKRSRALLLEESHTVSDLLKILVGDEYLFKHYLFDQQFAHQGWSGMVSTIEDQPQTLLDTKKISLHDMIYFEMLLEIDALDLHFGEIWTPLGNKITSRPIDLFAESNETELDEVLTIWQEAFEWTYYDQVLAGIVAHKPLYKQTAGKSFQAMFCIDDREFSLRHYLEKFDPSCETYGTPGFFGVEFFFKPENGKFYTKLCPAPMTPKYLIKEAGTQGKRSKDVHFNKSSHSLFRGWLITQTLGFWSAFKLFLNIFRPAIGPATASSFNHMNKVSQLTIENQSTDPQENDLQVGFKIGEMALRVEGLLMSIGLIKDFAPLVYVIGHGSSSVNNPHYAAYDCGACSGRPGSVNARVVCFMANHVEVRKMLASKGIIIPDTTKFIGGLHDTTRDQIEFFDETNLPADLKENHQKNTVTFTNALDSNSKERSRRFESINTHESSEKIHKKILTRSVSLFEPRPELNHATNTLCIVGRRALTKSLFLDRRAFLNSYDYRIDLDGKLLFNIMKPLGPVCGGINLEYYFSRVDNQKLGAGTKLPHNVMGLFGVANGIDGDLRPGLPSQMIEVHDPVRLMIIVEHFPKVVLEVIQKSPEVYEWFINEWVHLVVADPETQSLSVFKDGGFTEYHPLNKNIATVSSVTTLVESSSENIPVYLISQ